MARLLRVEFPGAIYHVSCRMLGDRRSALPRLYRDDADRNRFLANLGERVEQYDVRLYLFCLMTNHFHLAFETPAGNCSKFMQSVLTAYTVYYNLRHRRHGHLFDGRYKAKLVAGDAYLRALSRYVHLNPVQVASYASESLAVRRRHLRSYPWSSFTGYVDRRKALDFVDYGPVLASMGGRESGWRKRYREFVELGLSRTDAEFETAMKSSRKSIGDDTFVAWVDDLYQRRMETHARPEDVAFRHSVERLDPEIVLTVVARVFGATIEDFRCRRRDSPLRAVAARLLLHYAGLSQREIAGELDAGSGSAISKQLSRQAQAMESDPELRDRVATAETELKRLRAAGPHSGDNVAE